MQQKFNWTSTNAAEVNWNTLVMAMKHFPKDHWCISKIIHKWLPLHGSFAKEANPATQCPQCNHSHKDSWHFLKCQAPEQCQLFNQLHCDVQKLHTTYQIDPHFFQLLWQGLLSICTDTNITDQLLDYPSPYQTLFKWQWDIGWEHLYYGHISASWAHHIDSVSNRKKSGTISYSQATKLIWQYLLLVWNTRNSALHPPTPSDITIVQLQQQVDNLIHTAWQDPATRHLVKDMQHDHIMWQTPARIKQWIITSTAQMKVHIAATQKRAKLQTSNICQFLKPKALQNKDTLKPPWHVTYQQCEPFVSH